MPFFIIFVIIPIAEISVFMAVGEHIGLGTTLLLALLTAILGGAIVRHQGMQTLRDIQKSVESGGMPLGELFDGACLIAAGATLITPGFVTDTIGFLLLIPPVRNAIKAALKARMSTAVSTASHPHDHHGQRPQNDAIEGEFEKVDDSEDTTS